MKEKRFRTIREALTRLSAGLEVRTENLAPVDQGEFEVLSPLRGLPPAMPALMILGKHHISADGKYELVRPLSPRHAPSSSPSSSSLQHRTHRSLNFDDVSSSSRNGKRMSPPSRLRRQHHSQPQQQSSFPVSSSFSSSSSTSSSHDLHGHHHDHHRKASDSEKLKGRKSKHERRPSLPTSFSQLSNQLRSHNHHHHSHHGHHDGHNNHSGDGEDMYGALSEDDEEYLSYEDEDVKTPLKKKEKERERGRERETSPNSGIQIAITPPPPETKRSLSTNAVEQSNPQPPSASSSMFETPPRRPRSNSADQGVSPYISPRSGDSVVKDVYRLIRRTRLGRVSSFMTPPKSSPSSQQKEKERDRGQKGRSGRRRAHTITGAPPPKH